MTQLTLESTLTALTDCLTRSWADVLNRLRGHTHSIAVHEGGPTDLGSQPLWLSVTFEGALVGESALVLSTADVQTLTEPKAEAAPDSAQAPAPGSALQDSLKQALIAALSDFQSQYGPLVGQIRMTEAPAWTPGKSVNLAASSEELSPISLYLLCSPALKTGIPGTNPLNDSQQAPAADNLDLVMNAGLKVTLRFGQQRLTLSELALLGPGSIVELDRKVQEPVELVLGRRTLAKGEVLIVDGNYGLRVTEMCVGASHVDL